jgi:cytochrome P450
MILRFVREDTFFDSYAVPAGSVVMASAQIMHRDARYFHEPYLFDPTRWTPEASAGRAAGRLLSVQRRRTRVRG